MNHVKIILLAIALSIDAFVVSFAYGLMFEKHRVKNALLLSGFTGTFQGIMPVIGYFLIYFIQDFISPVSKILVFAIFMILGLNFIKDGIKDDKEFPNCLSIKCLFIVATATSIDALAAGMTLALSRSGILFSAVVIAIITFINSIIGFSLGCCLKKLPTMYFNIFAGIILMALALKSLL